MSNWVKLGNRIALQQGSALSMPFQDRTFDGGYMLHVGMNIEDKVKLFAEIHRVLKPGATFGVYDIMRREEGELAYPVPWAKDNRTSKLATLEQYKQALRAAGFEVAHVNNRRYLRLIFSSKCAQRRKPMVDRPRSGCTH